MEINLFNNYRITQENIVFLHVITITSINSGWKVEFCFFCYILCVHILCVWLSLWASMCGPGVCVFVGEVEYIMYVQLYICNITTCNFTLTCNPPSPPLFSLFLHTRLCDFVQILHTIIIIRNLHFPTFLFAYFLQPGSPPPPTLPLL